MITAGIDVGLENTKIVILQDGNILASMEKPSGGFKRGEVAKSLWQDALKEAGISENDVEKLVATGQGKYDVEFADRNITEVAADIKVSNFLFADVTSIVDIGADQIRVIPVSDKYKVKQAAFNQKCSSGVGGMFKYLARRLDMSLDDFSNLGEDASKGRRLNDGCIVFAELDVLEMLNECVPKEEIAGALTEAAVVRVNSVLNDKIVPEKESTVLIGGMTKNKSFVTALKKRTGIEFIVPEKAEYGTAIGAALFAADC